MRRPGLLAVYALLVALTAFAWQCPATWLARELAARTDARVVLAEAQGTVWKGSARVALRAFPGTREAGLLPGRLAWSVDLGRVWRGQIAVRLRHDGVLRAPVEVAWRDGALHVSDGAADLPAEMLAGVGAPFNTLRLEGRLHLAWREVALPHARLAIDADGVSSALSPVRPLGSYTVQAVVDAGGRGTLTLITRQGPLQMHGNGSIAPGMVRFLGEASAAPDAEEKLQALLSLIGRREGGVTRLQL